MTDAYTPEELRVLVHDAAKQAVEETLLRIGVNTSNPISAQEEFATLRELRSMLSDKEFQADLQYLRSWRNAMDSAKSKGMISVVALLISGMAAMVLLGVQEFFAK